MTSDHSALLASVLARPRDDAPRLVIADWYREHGHSELADFVGWQVTNPKETCRRTNNAGEWSTASRLPSALSLWFQEFSREVVNAYPAGWTWTWRRGFVDELSVPGDAAAFDLGAVRKVWPVTRVTVTEDMTEDGLRMLRDRLGPRVMRTMPAGLKPRLSAMHPSVKFILKLPAPTYQLPEGFRRSIAYSFGSGGGFFG